MPGSARAEILETIARALKRPATPESLPVESSRNLVQVVLEIRRKCERLRGELIEQFESELQNVGARFHRATDGDSVVEHIGQIASARQARTVIGWDAELFGGIDLAGNLEKKGIRFITEASENEFIRYAGAQTSACPVSTTRSPIPARWCCLREGDGLARSPCCRPSMWRL